MSNSGSQPLSFTFVPPPHQTTVATVVHTAAMAKSAAMRADGEEASVSSSDHAIPRSHPTAVTTSPMNIPSTGGGMIRAPFASHEVTMPLATGGTHSNTPVTQYPQYISTSSISPFHSVLPTLGGSMSHEAMLNSLRTQLQFTVNGTPEDMNALMTIAKAYVQQEKSVTASVDWENRKSEKKTTSTLTQPSYANRKSLAEASARHVPFRREAGRFTPHTPREGLLNQALPLLQEGG
ncbi:hypothetical protein E3N88_27464 [Mikania micrantha]|uniref:Uncharacterized protein n=1 Tax=Mikania micrantha TaxID=192012 RepID=A0A5N6MWQ2_9ASTR|nr:hypothetical protein E3N88_27464 [Mikania micrantha]